MAKQEINCEMFALSDHKILWQLNKLSLHPRTLQKNVEFPTILLQSQSLDLTPPPIAFIVFCQIT